MSYVGITNSFPSKTAIAPVYAKTSDKKVVTFGWRGLTYADFVWSTPITTGQYYDENGLLVNFSYVTREFIRTYPYSPVSQEQEVITPFMFSVTSTSNNPSQFYGFQFIPTTDLPNWQRPLPLDERVSQGYELDLGGIANNINANPVVFIGSSCSNVDYTGNYWKTDNTDFYSDASSIGVKGIDGNLLFFSSYNAQYPTGILSQIPRQYRDRANSFQENYPYDFIYFMDGNKYCKQSMTQTVFGPAIHEFVWIPELLSWHQLRTKLPPSGHCGYESRLMSRNIIKCDAASDCKEYKESGYYYDSNVSILSLSQLGDGCFMTTIYFVLTMTSAVSNNGNCYVSSPKNAYMESNSYEYIETKCKYPDEKDGYYTLNKYEYTSRNSWYGIRGGYPDNEGYFKNIARGTFGETINIYNKAINNRHSLFSMCQDYSTTEIRGGVSTRYTNTYGANPNLQPFPTNYLPYVTEANPITLITRMIEYMHGLTFTDLKANAAGESQERFQDYWGGTRIGGRFKVEYTEIGYVGYELTKDNGGGFCVGIVGKTIYNINDAKGWEDHVYYGSDTGWMEYNPLTGEAGETDGMDFPGVAVIRGANNESEMYTTPYCGTQWFIGTAYGSKFSLPPAAAIAIVNNNLPGVPEEQKCKNLRHYCYGHSWTYAFYEAKCLQEIDFHYLGSAFGKKYWGIGPWQAYGNCTQQYGCMGGIINSNGQLMTDKVFWSAHIQPNLI